MQKELKENGTPDPHNVSVNISITVPKQDEYYFTVTRWVDDTCACGQPSDVGCHGVRDNKIYDEYYCEPCYNRKKRGKE